MLLFVVRQLCVYTFPALFKMHKTRSDRDDTQTRKFMLFLDREVESNVPLIAAFCSIVCCIFFTSAAVFFQYFPAEESAECLEKDNHGRTLFCYSNSSLPVDCGNFSVTELRELKFHCYAIALPVGLGIAVAAAFGLAEVGIVGVTIFVKVTEGVFNKINKRLSHRTNSNAAENLETQESQNQAHCCGCCKLSHANKIWIVASIALIMIVFITSSSCAIYTVINLPEADKMQPLHILYYFAYLLLPMFICIPLIYIVIDLETHCDKGEYISIGADQKPPDQRDWDVESEALVTEEEHDEASNARVGCNTNGVAPEGPEVVRGNNDRCESGVASRDDGQKQDTCRYSKHGGSGSVCGEEGGIELKQR